MPRRRAPHHPGPPLLPPSPPTGRGGERVKEVEVWFLANHSLFSRTEGGRPGEEGRGDEGPRRRTQPLRVTLRRHGFTPTSANPAAFSRALSTARSFAFSSSQAARVGGERTAGSSRSRPPRPARGRRRRRPPRRRACPVAAHGTEVSVGQRLRGGCQKAPARRPRQRFSRSASIAATMSGLAPLRRSASAAISAPFSSPAAARPWPAPPRSGGPARTARRRPPPAA